MKDAKIQQAYEAAKARYAEIGVDTDAVLEQIAKVSLKTRTASFRAVFRLPATIPAKPATSKKCAKTSKR
mgnify:CR=1 FL=1